MTNRCPSSSLRGLALLPTFALLLAAGCRSYDAEPDPAPAVPTEVREASPGLVAERGVVSAGHHLAAEAGVEVLRAGGNAVDAGVATAFAIGVVDTGNAGVGGGGGMLIHLAKDVRAEYVEFYSEAASARGDEGSASNVALPGHVAGLLEAHERFGALPREDVLAPAIRLAEEGFLVSAELAAAIDSHASKIEETGGADAAALFVPGGEPLSAGSLLVQEEKATTLRRIAAEGRDGFYRGPVAEELVEALNERGNPATLEDLASLEARWQRPVVGGFRDYAVLSAPPPLGGTQVVQPLVLMDRFELAELGLPTESAEAAGRILDAIRIGRRDYNAWVHDPEEPVPGAGLVSEAYAAQRAELVGQPVPDEVPSGDPWEFEEGAVSQRFMDLEPFPPAERPEEGGEPGHEWEWEREAEEHTTHLSVVDEDRNAVAITMTLGPSFGSGFYAAGAFFNNGITRFGSSPEGNRWAPRRTPRSNTSPTIVLEDGDVRLVTGAQGGSRIPNALVFNILYALEYGFSAAEAMAAPRAFPFHGSPTLRVERGFRAAVLSELGRRGYEVEPYEQQDRYFAGAHMVVVGPDGRLEGAADLRRSGAVAGY